MRFVRRYLAVGSVATAVDVAAMLALVLARGWQPAAADAAAIAAATAWSGAGHALFSWPADPKRRWYRDPVHYLGAAAAALAVDVATLAWLTRGRRARRPLHLVAAKVVSLSAGFATRALFFRRAMFAAVRDEQSQPAGRPAAPGDVRLSVVIPAYEESGRIGATVRRVRAELADVAAAGGLEVVVVDDGSRDATSEEARAAGADRVVTLVANSGKGAAVRAGVLAAAGRTVAFTDADLAYAPGQIADLTAAVESGWDVVVGSRKHTETTTLVAAGRLREVGGRVINLLTSLVLLGQYRDTQCGLKAFRADVGRLLFERSRVSGFAFDVELFHLVERYRLSLLEVPVEVVNSSRSTVRVARDATRLVRDLFRIRAIGRAGGYELTPDERARLEVA